MTLTRFKLTIEYDGTDFSGWQRVDTGASVQQTLEDAIAKFAGTPQLNQQNPEKEQGDTRTISRLWQAHEGRGADRTEVPEHRSPDHATHQNLERGRVYGAGRTDAGVHATAQVAHVDLPSRFSAGVVQRAINYHVRPKRVVITHAEAVSPEFHARFSATARCYRYQILQRIAPPILMQHRALHVPTRLDIEAMQAGGTRLLGLHDFTSFRASQCQAKSPHITIDRLEIWQLQDQITLEIQARSFLHHMVRNIVGSLLLVGKGVWSPENITEVLAAKHRAAAGPTAVPYGLYLHRVEY